MKRSKIYDYSKEELQNILDSTAGFKNALEKLNIHGGSSNKTLSRVVQEYNLDISKNQYNAKQAQQYSAKNSYPLNEILVENSNYTNMDRLKIRLVREGYKLYRCEQCGISSWNGKALSLQIHHKNGKHNDNRLGNLQLLCPNCHSQTDNFGAYNSVDYKKKVAN